MIELELVSWKSIESITDDKKVLKAGEGYEKPNDGTRAKGEVFEYSAVSLSLFYISVLCYFYYGNLGWFLTVLSVSYPCSI